MGWATSHTIYKISCGNRAKCLYNSRRYIHAIQQKKFRLQHNEIILSLQYCNLSKQFTVTAEEWMGRLRVNVLECKYKENDRHLKE